MLAVADVCRGAIRTGCSDGMKVVLQRLSAHMPVDRIDESSP